METIYTTREEWLTVAVDALSEVFKAIDVKLPAVRVSVGWPGGRGNKNAVIGQCWASAAAADKVAQLFVSPRLDDAVQVLAVLTHELVHAVDDCKSGHKGAFTKIAKGVGLTGKMTATVASEELASKLGLIASALGDYPHAALTDIGGAEGPKKQGTRMLKVECAEGSGYTVRMTRTWIDSVGCPVCPCHGVTMEEAA
jgi:hypothetical protein